MSAEQILKYLSTQGERLDTEIAAAIGSSIAQTRRHLSELTAAGQIMSCLTIKYEKGKKIEGISCRMVGYVPKAAPGRKSKAQLTLS